MKKILLSLLMIFSIVGCGDKNEKNVSENNKKENEKIVVKIATWETVSKFYNDLINEYEKINPNIDIQAIEATVNDYPIKVSTMLASGDNFDVVTIKTINDYVNFSKNGYILNLQDVIDKELKNEKAYGDIFNEIKLEFANKGIYMIPYRKDIYVMYYNKELYDRSNIKYPTENLTWEELRKDAKTIKEKTGIYGFYLQPWTSQIFNWPISQGKGAINKDSFDFSKNMYEYFLEMQNLDKTMMSYNSAKAANAHYSGEFGAERTANLLMGTWFIQTMINDNKTGKSNVKWGIAPVPHFEKEPSESTAATITGLAINKNSKNKEEALKFIKWMSGKEAALIQAKNGSYPAYIDEEIINEMINVEGFPKDDISIKALTPKKVVLEMEPQEKTAEIIKSVDETHILIMSENISLENGIKEMNDRAKEIINE